jgi:MOSC domain-containing protein YiiM
MDTCDECGFQLALWTAQDVERTVNQQHLLADQVAFGQDVDVSDLLAPLQDGLTDVHAVMHRLHLAGRRVHAATPSATGVVAQLNASGGGVPKLPVPQASVDGHGLVGDVQADRAHHGRPWQALCLWSADIIESWAHDGHPIAFGSAGENITVRGLDWARLTPGARLQIGSALVQVSSYAIPCSKNAQWFADGWFRRMAHDVTPGTSRLYAAVLRHGEVAVGDAVVVEP